MDCTACENRDLAIREMTNCENGRQGLTAEIIAVGTELLLGHTINTDAAHVARVLAGLGINLMHTCVVGDNAARLALALSDALVRSDIVITTGGLGPTDDDLTKQTVASVANAPLEEHAPSMQRLREYFGSRQMTENQLRQAWLPRGATVFANPNGTAPGCAVSAGNGKFVILLPGPPSELVPMLEASVIPFLAPLAGGAIASFMVRTFGIGEGAAATVLADLLQGSNPTAATYAADGEMFVRVTARAGDAASASALAKPLVDAICARLGDVVYGINVGSLEEIVVPALAGRGMRIATAESCTGGLLAMRLSSVPGASAVFGMGMVAYANEAKIELLGVDPNLIAAHGAVSVEVASAMAENVRRLGKCELGLGITGIAGPGGGTEQKPVGLAHIALASASGVQVQSIWPQGRYLGRQWTRTRTASTALDMIRRHLSAL